MEKAEIGLIGLGVMGSNLALNIAEKGNRIAVFNRTAARPTPSSTNAGDLQRHDRALHRPWRSSSPRSARRARSSSW